MFAGTSCIDDIVKMKFPSQTIGGRFCFEENSSLRMTALTGFMYERSVSIQLSFRTAFVEFTAQWKTLRSHIMNRELFVSFAGEECFPDFNQISSSILADNGIDILAYAHHGARGWDIDSSRPSLFLLLRIHIPCNCPTARPYRAALGASSTLLSKSNNRTDEDETRNLFLSNFNNLS